MANESRTNRHKKEPQEKTKKAAPKKKKGKNSIIGKIFLALLFLGCILFLAGVALFAYYIHDTPKLTNSALDATVSSQLYAANNENFIDIGTENRVKIDPTDVPEQLADAIVSIEEQNRVEAP